MVTNLFPNFRKSHLNTVGHIKNYYQQKEVKFVDHLQAGSTRSNPMVITVADHKSMVSEGIEIVATVNESLDLKKVTFKVVGDLLDSIMKAFWFRVKCLICPKELL